MILARAVGVRRGGRWLLRDVDAVVVPGQVLAIIGPNGAGKSTLLSVLSGALRPNEGGVVLEGTLLHRWRARDLARRRAVMAQSARAAFAFTARQVVALGRLPWHGTPHAADDAAAIARAAQQAGVEHLAGRTIATLSGGEAARVHFARTLAQLDPARPNAALLLDEPTASLDAAHRGHLLRHARAQAALGVAVAIVLHDLNEALFVADAVLMLHEGRVAAHGPPRAVLRPEVLQPVYGVPFIAGDGFVLPVLGAAPLAA
jgi:iron complex transport system ATP-binding protein